MAALEKISGGVAAALQLKSGDGAYSSTVKRPLWQTILIVLTVTLGAAVMLVVLTGGAKSYNITTGSMEPTLPLGSRALVIRSSRANRGDIVVFRYPLDERLVHVKRVVGVAGDTIEIRAKKLLVN